ncbi:hypothetical protein [Bacteroides pyogenes]|uniref:hypothetical protein n=1 Tax=Bacteroides pyogenes TaxID=310300 RepID=UPI0011E8884A|nr:hypothetical protein [Bacteroides pyogenes]MDY4248753.1 hypothetical protein [Bacteroides pyogenes]
METDTAGFVMKLRRLRGQGLGRSSPKAYLPPGAVSCTASMSHPISSTEFVVTPDLSPNSFDVPERSANGASPNPDEPRRSFL